MNDRSSIEKLHPQQGTRPFALMLAIVLTLMLAALPASMFAQIQLDGDAKKGTGTGSGTDWDEVNCPNASIACAAIPASPPGGGSIAKTGLVVDRPEPAFAQFTGGGSKDEQDITSWRHRSGTPPSKDDLSHAFAAAFTRGSDNHTILAFGMDRYDTSGDAQLGFWFLGQNPQPAANGTFTNGLNGPPAEHENGDLLVLVNFSNGGTTPTTQVFRWQNGAVASLGIGGTVLCSSGTIPAAGFCGITNAATVDAPWTYESKDGSTSFPRGAFFEGGIDLTALGLTGCFTGFIAESRSSTSITATLKDFADPGAGFNLCSIGVTKACVSPMLNAAQTHIIYTIRGQVTNNGAGTLYNISLTDNTDVVPPPVISAFDVVDCADMTTDIGNFPVSSLAAGAPPLCYKATMTVPIAQNGISDTAVTVTADTEPDGSGAELTSTSLTIQCPNLQVNPRMRVEKDCSTSVVVLNNQVVVQVNITGKVCNTGDSDLTNVRVEDIVEDNITTTPNPLLSGITLLKPLNAAEPDLTPGACRNFTGSYIPSGANGITNPANVTFTDTVKATAVDILQRPVPNKNPPAPEQPQPDITDSATCPLCPTCLTCTTP